jgi:hypothetical protein
VTYKIPEGWISREADSGKGIVFQPPGAERNNNAIKIMEPTEEHPNGYVRIYNSHHQPVDYNLKPLGRGPTHIPEEEEGPFPDLPLEP